MPKVSVLVPIYNMEKYLEECLDSIAKQTLTDIEVICINDGSTDGSLAIINEYVKKDRRFRVIDKENGGYGSALNRGLEIATGEYVGIVDSDDKILPEMYDTLYYNAHMHDLDFIRSDYYHWLASSKPEVKRYCTSLKSNFYNTVYCPVEYPEHIYNVVLTCSGLYKLQFLKENGIRYREVTGAFQDHGFWFQATVLAERAMYINEAYYLYRYDNPYSTINAGRKVYGTRASQPNRQIQYMTSEYDYLLEDFVSKDLSNKTMVAFYWKARYHNCLFALDRAGMNLTEQDCALFLDGFKKAKDKEILDTSHFTAEMLKTLEETPKALCQKRKKQVQKLYRKPNPNVFEKACYTIQDNGVRALVKKAAAKGKQKLVSPVARLKQKAITYGKKVAGPYFWSITNSIQLENQRQELMFWISQHREGETMTETKMRVFRNMPKAEGSLRERQLEYTSLLEELKKLLDENNLIYWPMGGTMIGMLRHDGFIPWDDDIDISMMYEDKEKLYEIVRNSKTLRIDEVYWLGNKMLRCPRVQFKDYSRKGMIDIFLWERANYENSNDAMLWKKRNAAVSAMNAAYRKVKSKLHGEYQGDTIKNEEDRKLIEDLFEQYRSICLKDCGGNGTTIFGSVDMWFEDGRWCAVYNEKDIFPMRDATFENVQYKVPKESEKMLQDQYGDWLSFPKKVTPNHGG